VMPSSCKIAHIHITHAWADLPSLLPGQSRRLLADAHAYGIGFSTVILFKNRYFRLVCPGFEMFLGPPLNTCEGASNLGASEVSTLKTIPLHLSSTTMRMSHSCVCIKTL
jgi:hypothetical protein